MMAIPGARNVAQGGDALALLRSLPDACARLVFFDPQHRENLDKLEVRQRGRAPEGALSAAGDDQRVHRRRCREAARVLMPGGYLMRWQNAFQLVQGHHLRVADALQCVDLIAWDNQHLGKGYRARRRGDYLVMLQKPPIKAKATWRDHGDSRPLGREGRPQAASAHQAGRPDRPLDRRRHRLPAISSLIRPPAVSW